MDNGSLMAMAAVAGQPFELADHAARNARLRLLNTLYRNMADDNVALYWFGGFMDIWRREIRE